MRKSTLPPQMTLGELLLDPHEILVLLAASTLVNFSQQSQGSVSQYNASGEPKDASPADFKHTDGAFCYVGLFKPLVLLQFLD